MRRWPIFLLPLFLAACQTSHWERAETGAEVITADMNDCQIQARREAYFQSWRASPFFFAPSPYRRGGVAEAQWRWQYEQRIENDRYFREQQLARFCMRNKGYQLVPDEPVP